MPWNVNACMSIIMLCIVLYRTNFKGLPLLLATLCTAASQFSTFLLKDTTLSNHLHVASSFFQIFFYLTVDSLCFGFSVERLSSLLLMLELCTNVSLTGNLIFSAHI